MYIHTAKTDPEILINTRRLFERLCARKVAVNPKKTELDLKEVGSFGHLVCLQVSAIDSASIDSDLMILMVTNYLATQIRIYNGAINCVRQNRKINWCTKIS